MTEHPDPTLEAMAMLTAKAGGDGVTLSRLAAETCPSCTTDALLEMVLTLLRTLNMTPADLALCLRFEREL